MGLNPTLEEKSGVASICSFILEAPMSTDGRAILRTVRERVDEMRSEAKRLHSEERKDPTTGAE